MNVSDKVVAWLRTQVPVWWGLLVVFVLNKFDWLQNVLDFLSIDPTNPVVVTTVTSLVVGAVYVAIAWVQRNWGPYIPDWILRIFAGSIKTPNYTAPTGE